MTIRTTSYCIYDEKTEPNIKIAYNFLTYVNNFFLFFSFNNVVLIRLLLLNHSSTVAFYMRQVKFWSLYRIFNNASHSYKSFDYNKQGQILQMKHFYIHMCICRFKNIDTHYLSSSSK
jgi:hypothetical protein